MTRKALRVRAARIATLAALMAPLSAAYVTDAPAKGVSRPPPALAVSGGDAERAAAWSRGFDAVYSELLENLRMPSYPFETRYAQPGPAWPDDVYVWDTAFISRVWQWWDDPTAMEINRAVLDHGRDGMLRHVFSADQRGQDTQPPVMAWAVMMNSRTSRDKSYLEYAYPILREYNQWLYQNRRHPSGLFFWVHPFESGMDNSPRFTNRAVTQSADMRNLLAVDLSSYMVLQNNALALMAAMHGSESEMEQYQAREEELKNLINQLLWDKESGLYYDRDMNSGELVKIKTIASLIPLFCRVPDQERAERLKDHIMDPREFNTPLPLPSVARDEPDFFLDMWRGPVWINTSYMVIEGLYNYGFGDEASELAFRTVDWVYKCRELTGEFWEFYDPERMTIERLHRKTTLMKRIMRQDKPKPNFVGWTGLVNNLVIEKLMGIDKTSGIYTFSPRFPDEAMGMTFELTLPADDLVVKMRVTEEGQTSVSGRIGERGIPAKTLQAGECFEGPRGRKEWRKE